MKFIISFYFLLLFSQLVNAQSENPLRLGIRLTPEFAKLSPGFAGIEFESKFTIGAGVQVQKPLSDFFGLETGLYFVNKGYGDNIQMVDEAGFPAEEKRFREHYLNLSLPLLARISFKALYFSAGPSADFVFKHLTSEGPANPEYTGNIRKLNISLHGNLGVQMPISDKLSSFVEVRYSRSLLTITDPGVSHFVNYGLGLGVNYSL